MTICLDVDGVIGNFVSGARQWADEIHDAVFTDEQITDYDIMTAFGLPNGWPSFIDWLSESCFCRHMPLYPGAREFVNELRALDEVVVVTSPFVGVRNWEADRREWLSEHFCIGYKDVISCHRKELVRGHLLIDDKLANCEAWVSKSAHRKAVVFDQPWNRQQTAAHGGNLVRVRSYEDVLKVVRESLG